jgi:hypothetical protein
VAILVISFAAAQRWPSRGSDPDVIQVKSPETLPALPASAKAVNLGSLSVRAAPLLTDEETQDLFEANFQLAGLLPVRLEMTHNSGESIELKKLKFSLRDDAELSGRQFQISKQFPGYSARTVSLCTIRTRARLSKKTCGPTISS